MIARTRTLASLASIPTRAHLLPSVLKSLRPQVDRLCVYLNGYDWTPPCVRELADEHVLDPVNRGAEAKLHWATKHEGIVLTCDDDFVYEPTDPDAPPYVATMVTAVERWQDEHGHGLAIVTAHGRTYLGRPQRFDQAVARGIVHSQVSRGRWVNHPGTGVMAWDARRVRIPSTGWQHRNATDAQVAVWAQRAGVPIWLVPHRARWLPSLASLDPQGIFVTSKASGHEVRNQILREHSETSPLAWEVFRVEARARKQAEEAQR